jgi:hypothetical protein
MQPMGGTNNIKYWMFAETLEETKKMAQYTKGVSSQLYIM